MLLPIHNAKLFKDSFFAKLEVLKKINPAFDKFLLEPLIENRGYVIGGFLRDIINQKESRDIDIVFDISQDKLIDLLESSHLSYRINRMGGVKVSLKDFEADIWTFKNNWAFKNKVVKLSDKYILDSLAGGCFYNYDSVVINLHKGTMSCKNYNEFVNSGELDILRKKEVYKKRNPTLEANILRALYIKKIYNITFSQNCKDYLVKTILEINKFHDDPVMKIDSVKSKYEKYNKNLSHQEIYDDVLQLCYEYGTRDNVAINQTSLFL